jgi:hypothetical protein
MTNFKNMIINRYKNIINYKYKNIISIIISILNPSLNQIKFLTYDKHSLRMILIVS